MKLFPKLALTVSLLLVGTTLALSVCFYLAERQSIRTEADQERRSLLLNLVHITQESLLTNDDLLLVKYTRWLQKWSPSLVSASVVSPQGEVLAHSEPSQIGKSVNQSSSGPFAADTSVLVITQPVRLGNQWVATVSASFSERQFEEIVAARLAGLKRRLGLIAGGAVAAGLLISFLLALSWTRPICSLVQSAKRVGQGNYQLELSDTTKRRDELGFLSKAFLAMASELQELDHMKEDFVSAVTHELRSPLGAIESYLNLMNEEMKEGISPSEWQTYGERLRINTHRLTRFVNDLLDVAALERGKVTLEMQPVNPAILIQDVVALYAAKLAERKLTCTMAIPGDGSFLAWADPEKIRQVLINLLSNAIKFTPEQGAVELGVKEIMDGKQLLIYVKDSGLGIAPEDQAKIFNKFEQVHSARLKVKGPKGTGLGLSICRSLIELHGGTLGLESKEGEGSRFFFTLQKQGGPA
jgi:signal transduction histidine kinase